jgi:hypothetical protein
MKGMFPSNYYSHHLVDVANVYNRFKNQLASFSAPPKIKHDYFNQINTAIQKELNLEYHWYYDPLKSMDNIIDKIFNLNNGFNPMDSIHKYAHDELKK